MSTTMQILYEIPMTSDSTKSSNKLPNIYWISADSTHLQYFYQISMSSTTLYNSYDLYEIYSQTTDLLQLPTRFKGYYNNSTDILQTCYRGLWDLQNYSFYSNSMGMLRDATGSTNLWLPTGITRVC